VKAAGVQAGHVPFCLNISRVFGHALECALQMLYICRFPYSERTHACHRPLMFSTVCQMRDAGYQFMPDACVDRGIDPLVIISNTTLHVSLTNPDTGEMRLIS
jgi:hypothetical protein